MHYLYEKYDLVFPGTNIHWVTFAIIAIEFALFFYQFIYYLTRPSDKTRLWYLIFLVLLLQYNIIGGLLVDPTLSISMNIQYYIEAIAGIITTMYFPFYIYKVLNVKELKFFAYKGSLLFLFIPFVFVFALTYEITGDSEKAFVYLIFSLLGYAVFYIYKVLRTLIKVLKNPQLDRLYKEKFFAISLSLFLWGICLSTVDIFNLSQPLEHVLTNIGIIIMTIVFVKSTVLESRKEYAALQNMNELLTQKVKERTYELELATEQKTNAIISLAHEIRTPLTLVNNCLDEYMDDAGANTKINLVKENVEVLNNYVNTFFNEEKFRKGLSVYKHDQIVNLSEFITYKIASFKVLASKKRITLTDQIEKNVLIKADPEALHRILNNLLENAIKFTSEKGFVNVYLRLNETTVLLSVKDSGIGIPENMQDKIFDPYFQVSLENKYTQGMGMGLSIVNNCILSLGGKISVTSIENEGSEFTIELERYSLKENEALSHYQKNEISQTAFSGVVEDSVGNPKLPSILIVEDNYEMLRYLRDKLKVYYNIHVAESGKQALMKLKEIKTLNLIISDVMMDDIDGFAFFKRIKELPAYNHIPFIFLTAKTTNRDKMYGLSLGAVDYIQKPFSINELIKKAESIIGTARKQKEAILHSALEYIADNMETTVNKGLANKNNEEFDNNCKIYSITQREKEVIQLIAEGLSTKEISAKLFLSEKTVQKHCENIFSKVKVKSKLELIQKIYK